MKIEALGHVVLKVRDRTRAEAFYAGVLGLPLVARFEGPKMAFFSLGNHHDFAVMEVGEAAKSAEDAVGLAHVAFRIGDTVEVLREAKAHLEAAGLTLTPVDHGVTQSLYFRDPDGNELEVYVDVSDAWRHQPDLVAQYTPMTL